MVGKVLILVNRFALDWYNGIIEDIKISYSRWGFKIDDKYDSLVFWGEIGALRGFKDIHLEYFDENQALGKIFLFIVVNSLDNTLVTRLSRFPVFMYGFWSIYKTP